MALSALFDLQLKQAAERRCTEEEQYEASTMLISLSKHDRDLGNGIHGHFYEEQMFSKQLVTLHKHP